MKILVEGTIGDFLKLVDESKEVPLTWDWTRRIGTATVYRNGMIEAEVDDEEFAAKIRGRLGGYSIGN